MNDAQIWTALGVFAAALATMITLVMANMNGKFAHLSEKIDTRLDALQMEMHLRFEAVDRRFESIERRLDGLDRDVQGIIDRETGRSG